MSLGIIEVLLYHYIRKEFCYYFRRQWHINIIPVVIEYTGPTAFEIFGAHHAGAEGGFSEVKNAHSLALSQMS